MIKNLKHIIFILIFSLSLYSCQTDFLPAEEPTQNSVASKSSTPEDSSEPEIVVPEDDPELDYKNLTVPVFIDYGILGGQDFPCYAVAGPYINLPTVSPPIFSKTFTFSEFPGEVEFNFPIKDTKKNYRFYYHFSENTNVTSLVYLNNQFVGANENLSVGSFVNSPLELKYGSMSLLKNNQLKIKSYISESYVENSEIKDLSLMVQIREDDVRYKYCLGTPTAWDNLPLSKESTFDNKYIEESKDPRGYVDHEFTVYLKDDEIPENYEIGLQEYSPDQTILDYLPEVIEDFKKRNLLTVIQNQSVEAIVFSSHDVLINVLQRITRHSPADFFDYDGLQSDLDLPFLNERVMISTLFLNGDYYLDKGNYAKALEMYQEAYRYTPDGTNSTDVKTKIARLYAIQDKQYDALKLFDEIDALYPDINRSTYLELAWYFHRRSLCYESELYFKRAKHEVVPCYVLREAFELNHNGELALEKRDILNAIKLFDQAIEVQANYNEPKIHLEHIYKLLAGDYYNCEALARSRGKEFEQICPQVFGNS